MIPNYIYPDRNIDNVSDMMYPKELELRADKLHNFYSDTLSASCDLVSLYKYEQDLYDHIMSSSNTSVLTNMQVLLNYANLSPDFINICLKMILLTGETAANKRMCIRIIANTSKPITWLRMYDKVLDEYTVRFAIKLIDNIPIGLICDFIEYVPKKKISYLDLEYVHECKDELYVYPKKTKEIVKLLTSNSYHMDKVRDEVKSEFINNIPYKLDIPSLNRSNR